MRLVQLLPRAPSSCFSLSRAPQLVSTEAYQRFLGWTDSYSINLTIEGQDYNVEIVDTAGQEEYRGLWGEQTVRDGDGFILT